MESTLSTGNSIDIRQSHIFCSSPPSSYAASSSHLAEIDDHDCDLDSGYNDELDSPLLPSSVYLIPTSPWYDLPVADEIFIWVTFLLLFERVSSDTFFKQDFQLYADIARDSPVMKIDHSSSELTVDDDDHNSTWKSIGHCVPIDLQEYF